MGRHCRRREPHCRHQNTAARVNGVGLADVAEELVAKALSFAGTFDEPGDIHNLNGGGNHILRLDQSASSNRGSGTVITPTLGSMVQNGKFASELGVRQAVEQGGFTNVGESNNAAF